MASPLAIAREISALHSPVLTKRARGVVSAPSGYLSVRCKNDVTGTPSRHAEHPRKGRVPSDDRAPARRANPRNRGLSAEASDTGVMIPRASRRPYDDGRQGVRRQLRLHLCLFFGNKIPKRGHDQAICCRLPLNARREPPKAVHRMRTDGSRALPHLLSGNASQDRLADLHISPPPSPLSRGS